MTVQGDVSGGSLQILNSCISEAQKKIFYLLITSDRNQTIRMKTPA